MSHTYQPYKSVFGPKNPISLAFAGQYFLSLFSEHPVADATISDNMWCHLCNLWHYFEIYVIVVDAILRVFLKYIYLMK